MARGSEAWRERTARHLLERMQRRTTLSEGVGILQVWRSYRQQQARDELYAKHGGTGQGAEACRMIAVVDAAADSRADPEASWD
jgi:hypothetical protein